MVQAIFYENASFQSRYKIRKKQQFAEGIIRLYRTPEGWTNEEHAYWWLPETDGKGKILRPARMTTSDKGHFLDHEEGNQIMNTGRSQVLTYIGASSGSTVQWSQYLGIGTGAITATSPTDTSLSNETFRKAQTSFAVNGTVVDINFQLGTTDAQVTMTNAGIFGNGASITLGTGSLLTHALFSYVKGAYSVTVDYVINLL